MKPAGSTQPLQDRSGYRDGITLLQDKQGMLWPPGYHERICAKVLKMQLSSGQAQVGFQSGGLIDTVELSLSWDWE